MAFLMAVTGGLLSAQGIGTFSPQAMDPRDVPLAVVSQPDTPQSLYLKAHPKSTALPSLQGQARFRNEDGTTTAIVGNITHRDPNEGSWIDDTPVLSQTGSGWRVDGAGVSTIIRGNGSSSHTITQTYSDFETKHDSVLSMTFPALTYDRGFGFHFAMGGLNWTLFFTGGGTFDFSTMVAKRQGAKTYTFPVSSSGTLAVDASGQLVADKTIGLTRAIMIPKTGTRVACSPWIYTEAEGASFTCDDSGFTDGQLPYKIDPYTTSQDQDFGTYTLNTYAGFDDDGNYYTNDNTQGIFFLGYTLPSNAAVISSSCNFTTVSTYYYPGGDSVGCAIDYFYTDPGTGLLRAHATVAINTTFPSQTPPCCDRVLEDWVTVDYVYLEIWWTTPPDSPTLTSPANNSTGFSTSPRVSWGTVTQDDTTYSLYLGTSNPPPLRDAAPQWGGETISGLTQGTTYYWYVKATNPAGSSNSPTWQFTTVQPAATPTFSPAAGTYSSAQSVTIATTTQGATIRYTTDGSTPSETAGTVYSGAIPVSGSMTVKAMAYGSGYGDSGVASATYTTPVAAPTFSPAAGNYTSGQSVVISTTTPGATIRYTTDGSTPSETAGTIYSGAVAVNATSTLKAIAFKSGLTDSAVAPAAYTITGTVATPTFSVAPGTYTVGQSVAIGTTTAGATIRYTTDGSTPSETAGTVYSGAIAVSTSETVKAIAYLASWADSAVATAVYTITGTVATPTFSVAAGTYGATQTVGIGSTTSGATIRYTTNGSTPSETIGTIYTSPVSISSTTTLSAIAYETGWTDSAVASAAYTIAGTVATPTFYPAAGAYSAALGVTISSATSGATIRYTTDGSTPSETAGTVYSGTVTVGASETVKAIAYLTGRTDSSVATAAYTISTGGPPQTPWTYYFHDDAPNANSGALIYNNPPPDGSHDYEVRVNVHLSASGGNYVLYARATQDANLYTNSGSFYAFEMESPQVTNGVCTSPANFVLYKRSGGSTNVLATFQDGCHDGMTLRMVVRAMAGGSPGYIGVWANQPYGINNWDPDSQNLLTTGLPGVGATGVPSGNALQLAKVYPADNVAPNPINPQSVGLAVWSGRVDAQFQGVTDDTYGVGLEGYLIYREGALFASTPTPTFSDQTVAANTTYHYQVVPYDQHYNLAPAVTLTVSVPPANSVEPRLVGVRSLGSYWGSAGEQINMLSGNLNFSLPLVAPQSRGWSVSLKLNYDSQMWRKDSGGTWNSGRDVGYGLGWRLLAGAITPYYTGTWSIDHYVFTDSTGAEYRLDQNNTSNGQNLWSSQEGTRVIFDANANALRFPDGSFWNMTVQSGGAEQDAGTLYPSQMEDTNGNQIAINYAAGSGTGTAGSSARITTIYDARSLNQYFPSYTFVYNSDAIPHLVQVTALAGVESYALTYSGSQTLVSPFDQSAFGTTVVLQSVGLLGLTDSNGAQVAHRFQYYAPASGETTGEMTQAITSLGGSFGYVYNSDTYTMGNRTYREVVYRIMAPSSSATATWYSIWYDQAGTRHGWTDVIDWTANSEKSWYFTDSPGPFYQLATTYEESQLSGVNMAQGTFTSAVSLLEKWFIWLQDSTGTPYVQTLTTNLDVGTANATSTSNWQSIDQYGNVASASIQDYPSLNRNQWNFFYTYLTDSNYTSKFIRNRVTQAVTGRDTDPEIVLTANVYDQGSGMSCDDTLTDVPSISYHDSTYNTSFRYRGNPVKITSMGASRCAAYDIAGVARQTADATGNTVTAATGESTNYSLPSLITPNSQSNLATNVTYNGAFAVTSVTGANGATVNTTYDIYGRPATATSSDGVKTTYTYSYNPNTQTATLDADAQGHQQWKKTTLDGFGRAIEVDSGYDSTTVTIVETQYAPCACSPIGKMWRTSLPHAPGAPVQWTSYVYDARGRTIEMWKPDGSITHYSYAGNTTTVTDPAGKWKKFTYDAQNNLVMVTEPDPTNGNNTLTTNYRYNPANQLIQVTMTRSGVTQTRTFQWTGSDLTQSTNPENGTVTYTYDGAHHVTQRVDAKGQRTTYAYDVYGRLTHVRHYDASGNEQAGQDVDYGYDDPDSNAWGRLSTVSFGAGSYEYGYNAAGRVTAHRLVQDDGTTEADYQWDNRGRMTQMSGVDTLNYQYDAMSRLVGMTDANNATVATATYDQNSQLSELDWGGYREVRQYNALQQLTRMTTTKPAEFTTLMDMQYIYVAGANNGRVTQTIDGVTGDTQAFGYDALNRLVSVTSSLGNNESMAYDGFGNLTSMNGVSYTVDATTNRRTSGDGTTTYDANGNVTQWGQTGYGWDIENRMTSNGAVYDPWGKRVGVTTSGSTQVYFYSLSGQRLTGPNGTVNRYFGGKLIQSNGVGVATDRLGSVRANGNGDRMVYTAYGAERTATADGREKFGTYFRDGTGLDYADQRYYNNTIGRFMSPDPSGLKAVNPRNPITWNRYVYVNDDPINGIDPLGLSSCIDEFGLMGGLVFELPGCDDPKLEAEMQYNDMVQQAFAAAAARAASGNDTPDPNCVQNAISTAASQALGGMALSTFGFTDIWVQIVGTSNGNGGTYGETELNLSGGDVQGLVSALCAAGFSSNGQCQSNNTPLVGSPHTAPDGTPFTGNFRAPGLTNSVQVNTNVATGQVQIDVDPYNPAAYPILGAILHGVLQVLPNKITGGDNTYGCVH